jgi:hypothetical protein
MQPESEWQSALSVTIVGSKIVTIVRSKIVTIVRSKIVTIIRSMAPGNTHLNPGKRYTTRRGRLVIAAFKVKAFQRCCHVTSAAAMLTNRHKQGLEPLGSAGRELKGCGTASSSKHV